MSCYHTLALCCSVPPCKVDLADEGPAAWAWGAGKANIPSILLRGKVEQWVWSLLAALPRAEQVEHSIRGHCRRYEKQSIISKAQQSKGNRSLDGTSCPLSALLCQRVHTLCLPKLQDKADVQGDVLTE